MLFPPPENKRRGQRRPWGWTPSFRYAVSEERKCLSPKSKQIMEINKKQGFRVFGSHSPSTCLSHFFLYFEVGWGRECSRTRTHAGKCLVTFLSLSPFPLCLVVLLESLRHLQVVGRAFACCFQRCGCNFVLYERLNPRFPLFCLGCLFYSTCVPSVWRPSSHFSPHSS